MNKIYLKEFKDKQPESIQELLLALFNYHGSYGLIKSVTTYYNPECTQLQCDSDKYRSIDETFDIVNTYFPNTDIKTLMHELAILPVVESDGSKLYLLLANCSNIQRLRLCYYKDVKECTTLDKSHPHYNSKWTMGELLDCLGLEDARNTIKYRDEYEQRKQAEQQVPELV